MALVNLKNMLADADRLHYAVGAFNVVGLDSLHAILEAAEEARSPVILNIAEIHFKYVDLETLTPLIRRAAEKASVPVALHLDHGLSFEALMRAIRCGFTSVMFDGSTLSYAENVERTSEVVKMCHAIGVTVEAELGHVGGAEGGGGYSQADASLYTDPLQAKDFVTRTGVDALAVAIGSAHGLYKRKPKLDFDRLTAIKAATGVPLVLHGGSGIHDEDFRKAISLGISKVNFYTEMSQRATERIKDLFKEDPDFISFPDLLVQARVAMKETVLERLGVFGSLRVCTKENSICSICGGCDLPGTGRESVEDLIARVSRKVIEGLGVGK